MLLCAQLSVSHRNALAPTISMRGACDRCAQCLIESWLHQGQTTWSCIIVQTSSRVSMFIGLTNTHERYPSGIPYLPETYMGETMFTWNIRPGCSSGVWGSLWDAYLGYPVIWDTHLGYGHPIWISQVIRNGYLTWRSKVDENLLDRNPNLSKTSCINVPDGYDIPDTSLGGR